MPKPGDRSNFNTQKTCWKCYNNERPIEQKQQLFDGMTVENKGKLILKVRKVNIFSGGSIYLSSLRSIEEPKPETK